MKVPLLLFSGGMDSTFMLHQALVNGDVETLYVQAGQCSNKALQELKARKRIIAKLERLTGNRVLRDHIVKLDFDMYTSFADYSWTQPLMWITGALKVTDGEERHTHLEIGYVSGDSILSRLHNITQAWEHLQAFTKHHPIPVKFPLHTTLKTSILRGLNPHVWKDIWVCEMPTRKGRRFMACEQCEACHTRSATLHIYKRKYGQVYEKEVVKRMRVIPLPRRKPHKLEPEISSLIKVE